MCSTAVIWIVVFRDTRYETPSLYTFRADSRKIVLLSARSPALFLDVNEDLLEWGKA